MTLLNKKRLNLVTTLKRWKGLLRMLKASTLLVLSILLLLPNCYRVRLVEIKIQKPSPPHLKQIKINRDIDCNRDITTCEIIFNFNELLNYICKLEASPLWEGNPEMLCKP